MIHPVGNWNICQELETEALMEIEIWDHHCGRDVAVDGDEDF